jgi:alanine-glyoxylate transaminase/serine-glyoxylate transaminase/serine-pyruvate transaminase
LLTSYWGAERVYHHTAPISALYGLAAGLRLVLAEGLETRQQRHARIGRSLWAGLEALGMQLAVESAALRTPMLTAIRVPDGIDELAVRQRLRSVHLIEIGGGLGEWKGKVWRIGLMGHGARSTSVARVLTALAECLARQGRNTDCSAAVAAAATVASEQ